MKISHNNSQITLYEFYYFKEGMDPLSDPNLYTEHTFSFDRVYGPESSQQEVYENTARGAVQSVLEVSCLSLCIYLKKLDSYTGIQLNHTCIRSDRDWKDLHNGRVQIPGK